MDPLGIYEKRFLSLQEGPWDSLFYCAHFNMTSCQQMKVSLTSLRTETPLASVSEGRLLRPACVNAFHNDMVHFLGIGRWSGKKTCTESGPSRLFYGGLAKYTNWRCSCRCFLLEPESIFCDCLLFHVCSSASIGFAPASEAVALMSLDQTPIVSLPPDLGSRKYTGYESELSNPFTASTGSIYDGHLATPQDV